MSRFLLDLQEAKNKSLHIAVGGSSLQLSDLDESNPSFVNSERFMGSIGATLEWDEQGTSEEELFGSGDFTGGSQSSGTVADEGTAERSSKTALRGRSDSIGTLEEVIAADERVRFSAETSV